MAEYERKPDSEICATCKFYAESGVATSSNTGLCKRHPRLAQKHDDRTHRTNWCQYYEANVDKKQKVEEALAALGLDKMPDKVDNRHSDIVDEKAAPEHFEDGEQMRMSYEDSDLTRLAVMEELRRLCNFLITIHEEGQKLILQAVSNNDNVALMEAKGMVRTLAMIIEQLKARADTLATDSESDKPLPN